MKAHSTYPIYSLPLATCRTPTLSPLDDVVVFVVAKGRLPRVTATSCSAVAKEKQVVACHIALPPARNGGYTDGVGSAHSGIWCAGNDASATGDDEEGGDRQEGSRGMHLFGGVCCRCSLVRAIESVLSSGRELAYSGMLAAFWRSSIRVVWDQWSCVFCFEICSAREIQRQVEMGRLAGKRGKAHTRSSCLLRGGTRHLDTLWQLNKM